MLRYRADLRTLAFVAWYYVLLALFWVTDPGPWWVTVLAVLTLGFFSWIVAVITHNTVHCPMFHSRTLNRLFQIVLTVGYGHPVSAYVPGHNLSHHAFTQGPRDVMRTTKLRYRWNVLNLLLFLPTVSGAIMRNDAKFCRAMMADRPRWFRQLLLELAVFVAVSVSLLVLDWRKFLVWFYIPHVMAAVGIIGINYLQHDGCDPDSEYNHSRNFGGAVFGWLTFNNGYHTIHHMDPGLHWSLAPAAHAERVRPHIHPNLDDLDILAYMWRAFVWPGKRMRYDGTPVVLPPPVEDECWVPDKGTLPPGVSLGAES
jgi:fatty acid desaturase